MRAFALILFSGYLAGCSTTSTAVRKLLPVSAAIVNPPAPKTITLTWSYPSALETPDLVFNLYHTYTLTDSPTHWPLLLVIPGTERSASLVADQPQEFFALTASNQFGESDFATR